MTFTELKTAIKERAKLVQICPAWQALELATTQADLIAASDGLVEFVYNSGIVDDTLLAEFDLALLAAAGIYVGNNTVSAPTLPQLYFIGSGSSTLALNGIEKVNIAVLGNHNLSVTLSDSAYCSIVTYGATITAVSVADTASLNGESFGTSVVNVTNANVAELIIADSSILYYSASGASYAIIRATNDSQVTPTFTSPASAEIQLFDNAIQNEPAT